MTDKTETFETLLIKLKNEFKNEIKNEIKSEIKKELLKIFNAVVTEPVVIEPVVTPPVVTEPVVTPPVVTEPVVTPPVVTEPVTEPRVFKKVLIDGDENTGKSSIVRRMCNYAFTDEYIGTIGVEFQFFTIENTKLQIWDVAGQEQFRLNDSCYVGTDVVLYVFDLSNKASFHRLNTIIPIGQKLCLPDTVYYLIGNKSDTEPHAVTSQDMAELVAKYNLAGYVQVSAKSGKGIEDIRNLLVNQKVVKPVVTEPVVTSEPVIAHFDTDIIGGIWAVTRNPSIKAPVTVQNYKELAAEYQTKTTSNTVEVVVPSYKELAEDVVREINKPVEIVDNIIPADSDATFAPF
jgi:small GTP-binding protein